ncbi:MAG: RNA polymerase sigma factor [Phycisphaerales bacterium]
MSTSQMHSVEAWADLSRTLRRYALGLTGSAEAAEDLAQQTIARLLARRPDKALHVGYAYAAMTRAWVDEQRSLRRRLRRLRAAAAGIGGGSGRGGDGRPGEREDVPARRESVRRVGRAMDALPPRRRAALVLRAVEGLTYEQIAAALGCTPGVVRGELYEARRALRGLMEDPR